MKFIIFCVLALVAHCYGKETSPVQSCFYCESKVHPNCDDPFDNKTGTTVDCKEFIESQQRPDVSRKVESFNRAISQEKRINNQAAEYRCIKTRVLHTDSSHELIRMCVPMSPTISTACAYLKEEIDQDVVMVSCHECKSDNCNGSSYIALSLWSVFAFLLAKVF